jgi:hypothetical protein
MIMYVILLFLLQPLLNFAGKLVARALKNNNSNKNNNQHNDDTYNNNNKSYIKKCTTCLLLHLMLSCYANR